MFSTTPCFAVDMSNASRLLWFANITLPPGRSKRCDVIVNDSRVSSVHCRIYKGVEQDDGSHQILIEDTSSNGTKIQRAGQDMMEVSPGEKEALKHGDMVFLVHTDKNPSDSVSLRVDPLSPTDSSSDGGDGGGGATASAGDLAFGRYRVLKSLGSGSFALVKLGFDVVSNQLVALKYIDKYVYSLLVNVKGVCAFASPKFVEFGIQGSLFVMFPLARWSQAALFRRHPHPAS